MTETSNRESQATIDKVEQAWAVWTNTDLTEGRGLNYIRYYTRLSSTADRLAKGGYVQGTNCPVHPVKLYLIDGQWYGPGLHWEHPTYDDQDEEQRREKAKKIATLREAALQRAKELGLTNEELAILKDVSI